LQKKINNIFRKRANQGELKGILSVEEEPLVSTDFIGSYFSSIVDLGFTRAQKNMVKILAWYDNEWGYSARLAEMALFISKNYGTFKL